MFVISVLTSASCHVAAAWGTRSRRPQACRPPIQNAIIVEWEHSSYDNELAGVSHERGSKNFEYFRDKFANQANTG